MATVSSKNQRNKPFKANQANDPSALIYGKMAPQAIELESAVIGAIMLEPERMYDCLEIIKSPEVFYVDANQRIYAAIRRLYDKGSKIDFLTVCEELKANGELDLVGGYYYVTSMTKDVVSSANLEEHARIVIEKYMAREAIRIGGNLIQEAYDESIDVFDLIDGGLNDLDKIKQNNISTPITHISHEVTELLEEIDKQRKMDIKLTGVDTGFSDLNRITNGWQNSNLIILAARPAVGKTAFALNLIMNAVTSKEKPVAAALFTLEVSKKEIQKRILSCISHVGLTNINAREIDDLQMGYLNKAASDISQYKYYISDKAKLNISQFKTAARRLVRKHGIGLIVIDYLQLMEGLNEGKSGAGNREQEISRISRELKITAKELNIPIIALSQLNRDVEKRKGDSGGAKPRLSDIRESGAIEQDADIVGFLWKPSDGYEVELSIQKNRDGKCGDVQFRSNLDIQKFSARSQQFEPIGNVYQPQDALEDKAMKNRTEPGASVVNTYDDMVDDLPF